VSLWYETDLFNASMPHCSWAAEQYSFPPWGEKNLAALAATIRGVQSVRCSGPDILAFYTSLDFSLDFELIKHGATVDVHVNGLPVQILVSRVYAVDASAPSTARPVPSREIAPGKRVVEAWTRIQDTAGHAEAIAAVAEVGKLLADHTTLEPLPRKGSMFRRP
jgi:hypothetical protein